MNRKVKLGIYVESFPIVSETFVVDKVKYFLDLQYDVQIFTLKHSNQWRFFDSLITSYPDIKKRVHSALSNKTLIPTLILGSIYLLKELILDPLNTLKFLRYNIFLSDNNLLTTFERIFIRLNFIRNRPDILSIEFDTLGYGVVDIKEFLNCKIVVHSRGVPQATNSYYKKVGILKYLNKYTDIFIYASKFLYNNNIKLGLNKNIKSRIVYAGVNELFTENNFSVTKNFKRNNLKIISVGRLAWSKGHELGLEAVKIASRTYKNIKYIIIGDGPYKEAVKFAAKQLGLLDKNIVDFKGALPLNIINTELRNSDIFLQSSLSEGFGISVLEAQSMGLPVIVTNAGGLPETVEDNKSGFVVDRRDPYSIAKKIIHLYKNKNKIIEMGLNGKRRIRQNFKLIDEMRKISIIYKELLGK